MGHKTARAVAIYSRVSTESQTTENQERELQAIADRMGWQGVKVYRDHGVSGAKSRKDRPAFDALWRDATRRKFDVVMAWSVDRVGGAPTGAVRRAPQVIALV